MNKFIQIKYKDNSSTIINIDNILSIDVFFGEHEEDKSILLYLKRDILHTLDKKYQIFESEVNDLEETLGYIIKAIGGLGD